MITNATPSNPHLQNDAIEAASAAGITVVTAAGNNKGGDACTMSPASATSSITVGASTDTDAMASMSNIGSCLSMFAPGKASPVQ
jgi:subtilisin family serine protease